MKTYKLPLETIQQASHLAYKLSRPTFVEGTENDTTQYCFGWLEDSLGDFFTQIPEDLDIPIHHEIQADLLNGIYVKSQLALFYPTEEELNLAIDRILNNNRVLILDLIPSNWEEGLPVIDIDQEM